MAAEQSMNSLYGFDTQTDLLGPIDNLYSTAVARETGFTAVRAGFYSDVDAQASPLISAVLVEPLPEDAHRAAAFGLDIATSDRQHLTFTASHDRTDLFEVET